MVQGFGVSDIYEVYNVQLEDSGKYSCEVETTDRRVRKKSAERLIQIQELFTAPTISVTPHPVFRNDNVTLRCETRLPPPRQKTRLHFTFYREGRMVQGFVVTDIYEVYNVQLEDSGKYSCEVETTDKRVRRKSQERLIQIQELFTAPTISVTPHPVFRNDNVTLRCETRLPPPRQKTRLHFTFYREGRMVQGFGVSDIYEVYNVQLEDSGNYSCEMETTDKRVRKKSAERLIQIQELFTAPTISVTPHPVFRNDNVTLRCETRLPPPRQKTRLHFTFYREGRMVQGFGVSDIYEVYNVQLEDSGKYSCHVETTDRRVRKKSAERLIQIQELFTAPTISVTPHPVFRNDNVTLRCEMRLPPPRQKTRLHFTFYREGQMVQGFGVSDIYEVYNVQLEDSGKYSCHVETTDKRVRKESAERLIQIQEFFTAPTISVTPHPVFRNDNVTLTCETRLSPPRQKTRLHFTFYREGRMVQGFGVSDIYEVYNVQLEDSGNYSCAVETTDKRVRKESAERLIQIQDNMGYTRLNIIRLILSGCVIITAALFLFYHIKWVKSMEEAAAPSTT
ncbi:Fc receptor-like protein 5 isoform X2 [Engystomops pustulosus]|uniref:Fc receptor-like protein 5 isoform X2 n=1 Tax=Engystomops pustulosus TaxID=76066 RepID=UPI003AFAFC04